ncbi:MAG: hypothetical protein D8M58_22060 [Calditrichaeota bacterium]|nr:MAG: hypothetical protein DWQ03_11175 [Calditrichota bacterium]MBL1208098.1 hypothetical protein [Calditrichota bacterium]NOG47936.1 hypothetical protein [Calditrichota bacterium]
MKQFLFLTSFCFLLFSNVLAQKSKFDQIFLQDGLSQSHVSDILQDKFGYIWFATHDGLNRYDGYNIKIFRHDPGEPGSIKGNWINNIYTDSQGRIWCVLGIGGVSIYNPKTNSFTYLNKNKSEVSLVDDLILDFCEDYQGNVILTTPKGLNIIPANFLINPESKILSFSKATVKCAVDSFNGVWGLAADGLLYRFTIFGNTMSPHELIYNENIDDKNISNLGPNQLFVHNGNSIWLTKGSGQIVNYVIQDDQQIKEGVYFQTENNDDVIAIKSINSSVYFVTKTGGLYSNNMGKFTKLQAFSFILRSVVSDKKGILWLISNSNELIQFNVNDNATDRFSMGESLTSRDFTTALFTDNSQNIWIGTNRKGVLKFSPNKVLFQHFVGDKNNPLVTSFAEKSKNEMYIGTFGAGLFLYNSREKSLTNISKEPSHISSLEIDKKGSLWLGSANGVVFKIEQSGSQIFKTSISAGYNIRDILKWENNLYLATDGKGLVKYNLAKKTYKYFEVKSDGRGTSSHFVWALHRDKYDKIWLGMAAGGLNRYDPQSGRFDYFFDDPQNKAALNNKTVNTMYEDSDNLWLGTYSGGLNKLSLNTLTFSAITQKNGISGNMITGIIPGNNNSLWLATNNGVTQYNIVSGKSKLYDISDGLQSNEFYPGASYKSTDGHIYFGGINGFNFFSPDSINKNPNPPDIIITGFNVHNQPDSILTGLYNFPMTGGEEIILDYDHNYISVEFSATDFTSPAKNQYAYRLTPIDEKYLYIGNRHHASYNNLDPGSYSLTIKASNNHGVWNENGISIKLIIKPPFWQTVWFYILIFVLLTSMLIFSHRRRVKAKLKRALEIEHIREEEQTRIRIKTARDFHDEMGHRLTRISMLTELISRKENKYSKEFKYLLSQISDNANNLYLGARDFIWAIDPRNDSFYEMAIRMKDFGDELYDSTGIDFRVKGIITSLEIVNMSMDLRRQIPLIFKEGMTNILKHAQAKNVQLQFDLQDSKCSVILKDDGVGFDMERASSGLGLQNIQDRAKKIGALISIVSSPYNGTTITCTTNVTQIEGLIVKRDRGKVNS